MHSPKAKGNREPLTVQGNLLLVSIAESWATWLKNARFRPPDVQNANGPEEAISRDAPRHLRSAPQPKNLLCHGIRDPEPFKE